LTVDNGKLDFEAIKVVYDVDKVVSDINRLSYPASEEIKRLFFNVK